MNIKVKGIWFSFRLNFRRFTCILEDVNNKIKNEGITNANNNNTNENNIIIKCY